ncbi:hypothetical protein ES703_49227 [subsurface metagenome]
MSPTRKILTILLLLLFSGSGLACVSSGSVTWDAKFHQTMPASTPDQDPNE